MLHKKISSWLIIGLVFFAGWASTTYAEEIIQYSTDISVEENGSFSVIENILYDFGSSERHGIFRYIPTEHPQPASIWYKDRIIDIDVVSVARDGVSEPYELSEEKHQIYLKIGRADETITGEHTYQIMYRVNGGLSYFPASDTEIYWNINGSGWDVPIRRLTVHLSGYSEIFKEERACYQGYREEVGSCDRISGDAKEVAFSARNLRPSEEVTIAQSIDKTKVAEVVRERSNTYFFWIPALILWFIALGTFVYRYRTEYKPQRSIIAEYEPYAEFKPMYTGLLFDGRLDPKDITAGIVYLAEQGYLRIEKIETKVLFFFEVDDYKISLLQATDTIETEFQKELMKLLFGNAPTEGNTVTLGKLKTNHTKQVANQKILKHLKKDLEKDLESSSFFQIKIPLAYMGAIVAIAIGSVWVLFGIFAFSLSATMVFIVIGILGSLIILLFMYRRRTHKGYEALFHLKGFKEFLSVTEEERYAFHNAPTKSPEQFMEYLPYAIAFGVEKEWATVFEDITIPNPDWYDGGSGGASFSSTNLTTSLGAFSTAFASSSGSSASSGGGSAGGGGGGGGGGSW